MKKILIFILICLAIGGGIFLFLNQSNEVEIPEESVKTTIEGSLGYPSEEIPSNIKICAKAVDSDKEYCTSEQLENEKYKYGKGYKLEVSPGNYYIEASKEDNDFKGYYSTYVKCGMKEACISHFPITVALEKGDSLTGIDVLDWTDRTR